MNKEQVYDELIREPMEQIIKIAQQHGIAMVASFAIPTPENDSLRCTTAVHDENGNYPADLTAVINVLCRHSDGLIDALGHAEAEQKASH